MKGGFRIRGLRLFADIKPPFLSMANRRIDGDPVKPGKNTGFAAEPGEVAMDFDPDLLKDILCLGPFSYPRRNHLKKSRVIQIDQLVYGRRNKNLKGPPPLRFGGTSGTKAIGQ